MKWTKRKPKKIKEFSVASQRQLIIWRFKKHKVAVVSGFIVLILYFIAVFCEFLAPSLPDLHSAKYLYAPPQRIHFILKTENGDKFIPHVYGYDSKVNQESLATEFTINQDLIIPISMFVKGETYKMWGLFEGDLHLIGSVEVGQPFYLLGADRMGRDILSRVIYGARVSMSIGLVGVLFSFLLGILLGGISGYYGGMIDIVIQRITEFLRSIPTIPLWMALAAAIPETWSALQTYFAITIILSFISWTGLAQVVRGRFYSLKTEDFIIAARLNGCNEMTIIFKHMVPSFISHIIASVTLSIPRMIISETALSFLGVGLQAPVISWGVLLKEAQNIRTIATAPWLLIVPAVFVIITVLAMNFLGDGLRDTADPYNT